MKQSNDLIISVLFFKTVKLDVEDIFLSLENNNSLYSGATQYTGIPFFFALKQKIISSPVSILGNGSLNNLYSVVLRKDNPPHK